MAAPTPFRYFNRSLSSPLRDGRLGLPRSLLDTLRRKFRSLLYAHPMSPDSAVTWPLACTSLAIVGLPSATGFSSASMRQADYP